MAKMTRERMGEIAILKIKADLRKGGLRLDPELKRDIGNSGRILGITTEEGMQFAEAIIREMVDEAFKPDL